MIMHQNTSSTNAAWLCGRHSGTGSAGRQMIEVTRRNTSFGDRSFTAAAPHVCNSLPDSVRDFTLCEDTFAKSLKSRRGAFDY